MPAALRALAAVAALLLCADPLAQAIHLYVERDHHGWCEAHGHLVHVDEHGVAVGAADVAEPALWDGESAHEHGHHECPAVCGVRVRLAEIFQVAQPAGRIVLPSLRPEQPSVGTDLLAVAPKHGPPARV